MTFKSSDITETCLITAYQKTSYLILGLWIANLNPKSGLRRPYGKWQWQNMAALMFVWQTRLEFLIFQLVLVNLGTTSFPALTSYVNGMHHLFGRPLRNQIKRMCSSPHNVYRGCAPPVCVRDGSTKTNSSSALLKKRKKKKMWFTSPLEPVIIISIVQSMCPTWFWLFPQSWDLGHIRQRLLPRSRFQQNSVSDPDQIPVPLDSFVTPPQHQSLLFLGTKAAEILTPQAAKKLISCEKLRSKEL